MKFATFYSIFIIFATLSAVFAAFNPNPCAGNAPGTLTFVNDYAACEAYFFCNGEVAAVTTPCPSGSNFNQERQGCVRGETCEDCPAGTDTIAVSDLKSGNGLLEIFQLITLLSSQRLPFKQTKSVGNFSTA